MRACVRACMRACVRACVRACDYANKNTTTTGIYAVIVFYLPDMNVTFYVSSSIRFSIVRSSYHREALSALLEMRRSASVHYYYYIQ